MQSLLIRRRGLCASLSAALLLIGCAAPKTGENPAPSPNPAATTETPAVSPAYTLDTETFALSISADGQEIPISLPGPARRVEAETREGLTVRWRYPEEEVSVEVAPGPGYLGVTIRSDRAQDNAFQWPLVEGETYYLPLGEGKRVPSRDPVWVDYLSGREVGALEQLSMPFWAAASGESAVLCVMEDPFRTALNFGEKGPLQFSLAHQYPEIDPEKGKRFRFYLTENDPVAIAKAYRAYVVEQGNFVSLAQKAEQNPNVEKLYGAPFIYLFDERALTPQDVNWPAFRAALSAGKLEAVKERMARTESGTEALAALEQVAGQNYVDQYQKNVICRALGEALGLEDFYTPEDFPARSAEMEELLRAAGERPDEMQRIRLHQYALAANLPGVLTPVEQWNGAGTTGLIQNLQDAGIDRAWIGLGNGYRQAFSKPELVSAAVDAGYLAGPYDSYHSIHKPGEEQWDTAAFPDPSLYEGATVTGRDGEKVAGFRGVGRKLNPTLSLPFVRQRVGEALATGLPFNSWFVDCDATGEIYDDYSPSHPTTQQQDLLARLARMSYLSEEEGMVVGSEGGNDFAAPVIAFAHGIELPSFSWMDADMGKNKDSEYYIGRWYNPTGGVPEHFAKPIPIKDRFDQIFLNPRYQAPLYRLVYNDSVITTYHWDWSTFKIKGRTEQRMLREILFNIPPMYHLDAAEWETYGQAIARHTKVWSTFARQAVQLEMTGFSHLSDDGLLQMTRYGEDLSVVANFGDSACSYEGHEIPAQSLLILSGGEVTAYTPR